MQAYRPDRVVRVLTTIASIAFFAHLVAAVIALTARPSAKALAPQDQDWDLGLTVPIASTTPDETVTTRWGDVQLRPTDMRGTLRLPIGILPWWLFTILWFQTALAASLTLLFLHHLRRIFQRTRDGYPFDSTNAKRLNWLGLLAIALALLLGATEFVTAVATRNNLVSDTTVVQTQLNVNMPLVGLGLLLLALATIFRRGTELEREQSLTI